MRSVRSTTPAWTSRTERRRPRMALERISPPLWSGHWRDTGPRSPSVPRGISPVPLRIQCPAHHLPAARLACIAARSDSAEDRRGARAADDVSQGVWAGNNARHEGEYRGQCELGEELRPLRRGWGWAEYGVWIVPQHWRKGSIFRVWPREGHRSQVQPSWVSFVSAGPSQLRSSRAPSSARSSKMPALPPTPASSTAVVWQPLCSPSAHHLCGASSARLPSSSVAVVGVSLDSASSLRGPDSASARWPAGSTMAPSSLLSAVAHLSTGSAGLPRPSGSALVWRRPSCTSGLHSSGCASSLRPSGSVRLLHPLGSSSVLCRSGSTAAIWIPISASVAGAICSALVPRILPVALALRLSVSGSSSTCSATVGHHQGCGLGPAVRLLLRVPPVSSLAPPSFVTSLVSVSRPPPGCSSSSWASALVPTRSPPPSVVPRCYFARRTFREGGVMSRPWTVLCFCSTCSVTQFLPHVWLFNLILSSLLTLSLKAPVLSVSVCWSLNVIPCVPVSLSCLDLLKDCVLKYSLLPRSLLPGGLWQKSWKDSDGRTSSN